VNIGLVRGIPGAVASGTVNAQNGQPDTINCFGKNTVTVYVDRVDTVNRCARVVRSPAPARDRWRGAVSKNRAAPARKAKAHRAKRHHKRNHHNNSQRPLED
jgi:hypothetical protein